MAKITKKYDASNIKILEGLEAVRQRPGMYIGSTDRYGLHHMLYEVVDNSVDEAMAGHCFEITVTIEKDNTVSVIDNGRGIPIEKHKQAKKPAVEVVLTTLHAGGKFDQEGYKVSGGLHGVGVSVVNALSEFLEVEVWRDGQKYTQKFKRGKPTVAGKIVKETKQKKTGTKIRYKPDLDIFDTDDHNFDTLSHRLKEMAYLNRGLKIIFQDLRKKGRDEEYHFEGGLVSYVQHQIENKEALYKDPFHMIKEKDKVEVEIVVTHVKDYYDEQVMCFANNIRNKEGGTHLAGFRTGLTRSINNFAKRRDIIKDKDPNLTGNDVREGIVAIISVKLSNPQFEGQTKGKLGNGEVKGIVDSLFDEGFAYWLEKNPTIGKTIVNAGLAAQRVRNASRQAQDLARRKNALESSTLPGKLADCSERDASKCEVFIVEGDSAGGSAKQGRDRTFQAILPLRGKILNVEKARIDKILQNEELRNMITAIGPDVIQNLSGEEAQRKEEMSLEDEIEFVLQKIRYHKVVIMTDADVDGAHIRTLLLTFFYRYARYTIEAGCLYIAQPPLYQAKKGKTEKYAYNEKELEKILKEMGKDGVHIQRYKGLGEMNPHQLWETTMDPEKRTLLQVKLDDAEEADEIFSVLMGSSVDARKKFIQNHAKNVRWLDV